MRIVCETYVLLILLVPNVALGQSWQRIVLNDTPVYSSGIFLGQFWDADTGLVMSYNGKIFHTNNFFQTHDVDSTYYSHSFTAANFYKETGYIATTNLPGRLIKTIDKGKTWNTFSNNNTYLGEVLYFSNRDTGYSAYSIVNDLNTTFNGGVDWSNSIVAECNRIFQIRSVRDSIVYLLASTETGPDPIRIIRSNDFGGHWQVISTIFSFSSKGDFHFLDDTTCILVVDGQILKSKNACISFDTVLIALQNDGLLGQNAISFWGKDTGFVAFSGRIYRTYDRGDSWSRTNFSFDNTGGSDYINFISAVTTEKVIVGSTFGSIYKTETGGGTWSDVKEVNEEITVSIFPNPASDKLRCDVTGKDNEKLRYAIHSTDGRQLLQGNITQPNFEVNLAGLPMGLYFLQLQSAGQALVKKFVKY